MADMSIEKLKGILREKQTPPEVEPPVEAMRKSMEKLAFPAAADVETEALDVAGRAAEWVRAPNCQPGRAILYLHGGGYVIGSIDTHRSLAGEISRAAQASVLLTDYRLAPEHPFPAAVDDGVAALAWLHDHGFAPERTAIGGDSAGGGLVLATLLAAGDKHVAMPAAAVAISPWSDLTCANPAYDSRAAADPMVTPHGLRRMAGFYLAGGDAQHPHASPNCADDAQLRGLPPLLIHVGEDEILLDDAVAFDAKARTAGVDCTLEVWDGMVHVWHAFHPLLEEGRRGIVRVGEFLRGQWAVAE